jgi:hypothetical protein
MLIVLVLSRSVAITQISSTSIYLLESAWELGGKILAPAQTLRLLELEHPRTSSRESIPSLILNEQQNSFASC